MDDYKCKGCKGIFGLTAERIRKNLQEGHYMACPYCGSKAIVAMKFDGMKECAKGGEIDFWKIT